jgi:hypothetical protein
MNDLYMKKQNKHKKIQKKVKFYDEDEDENIEQENTVIRQNRCSLNH